MKKFFSLFAAVLFAGSIFAADATMTAGTNGSACTVNGTDGIKCGTSKAAGDMTITVGAGATKLTVYAAAWKGVTGASIAIEAPAGVTANPAALAITPDNGISNNSPFTLAGSEADFKFEVALTGVEAETTLTLSCAKRFVVWGATYETEGGEVTPVEQYYLVGNFNNWTVDAAYKLKANSAAEGEYKLDITLAEGNQEMKVTGVLEGREDNAWYPAGTDNNFVINDAGDYTIYFRPDGQGGEGWHYGCIFAEYHAPLTCAEFAALAANAEAKLGEVVVTYASTDGKNVWLRDATGSLLLYYSAGNYGEFAAGDRISGLKGTKTLYQSEIVELVPTVAASALTVAEGEAPAPEELTAAPVVADINKYVLIKGVTFEATDFVSKNITATIGEETFVLRNNFNANQSFDTEKVYNITGLVSYYSGAVQVYFVSAEEQSTTALDNANAAVKAAKTIVNGQLIIERDGKRFNLLGARL